VLLISQFMAFHLLPDKTQKQQLLTLPTSPDVLFSRYTRDHSALAAQETTIVAGDPTHGTGLPGTVPVL